jgi:hypothetical protein
MAEGIYNSTMKSVVFPLVWPAETFGQMKQAAKQTGLSTADIIRQSAKLGLPKLLEQMGAGRVTNVEPLPDKVARKLYAEREEDMESIRCFIAAQPKNAQ